MDNKAVPDSDAKPAPRFLGNLGTVDGIDTSEPAVVDNSDTESAPRFLDNLGSVDKSEPEK